MTPLTNIWQLVRPNIKQIKPYSPGKSSKEVREELGLTAVTKLAANENQLGPSPQAIAAMQQAAAEVHIYTDPLCRELTEALAVKLSRFGLVRKVRRQANVAKEAAEGAYIIGEGLLGGKYKGIFDCLELKGAKGTMFDYILVKGAELEKP